MSASSFALFLLLLPVLAPAPRALEAQTLRGRVVDALTDQPISGALVRLNDGERATTTQENGWFQFDGLTSGAVELSVHQLGYSDLTATVAVPGTDPLVLRLQPQPIELEGVEAYNERLRHDALRRAHDLDAFYRTFDRDDILASAATNALGFLTEDVGIPILPCDGAREELGLCVRKPGLHPCDLGGCRATNGQFRGISGIRWVARVPVYLDDAPLPGGLTALEERTLEDIYRVESFGDRGERQLRFYTGGYLQYLSTGAERPGRGEAGWSAARGEAQGDLTAIGAAAEGPLTLRLEVVNAAADARQVPFTIVGAFARDGAAMAGAVVELLGPAGERFGITRVEDESGAFLLRAPGQGSYVLRLLHEELGARRSQPFRLGGGEWARVVVTAGAGSAQR